MKTAVLVYGEFREFESAHLSWSFLKNFDYDIYFNTWDKTFEKNENLNIDLFEEVTKERILKYFPNAVINIEPSPAYSTSAKTVVHWKTLLKMLIKSDKNYDNIIILRCDLVLKEKNNFINNDLLSNENERVIYALSPIMLNEPPIFMFIQDLFFFGKTEVIKEIFLSFNEPDITRKDIHYHLSKHLINNDIYVKTIYPDIVDYFVMRSIHRKFLNLDFEQQKIISNEWWNAKHKNEEAIFIKSLLN